MKYTCTNPACIHSDFPFDLNPLRETDEVTCPNCGARAINEEKEGQDAVNWSYNWRSNFYRHGSSD